MADFNSSPPKLARYRSLRQHPSTRVPQQSAAKDLTPIERQQLETSLARSRSRYRNKPSFPVSKVHSELNLGLNNNISENLLPDSYLESSTSNYSDSAERLSEDLGHLQGLGRSSQPQDLPETTALPAMRTQSDSTLNTNDSVAIGNGRPGKLHKPLHSRSDSKQAPPSVPPEYEKQSKSEDSNVTPEDGKVTVRYRTSRVVIPISRNTTAAEVIKSVLENLPENSQAESGILLEYFGTVGIERPLRDYERVRNVMNGWDFDAQNHLLLLDEGVSHTDSELDIASISKPQPAEQSWLLKYSQKKSQWKERIVILTAAGQLAVRKPGPKDQGRTSVCHLSDFDIYRPTEDTLRRKVKPPEEFCLAVKSLQKSTIFESTYDFVHFFCTDDRAIAEGFYYAIQSWRSWYLCHVLELGQKQATKRIDVYTNANVDSSPPRATPREGSPLRQRLHFTKSSNQFDTSLSPERRNGDALAFQQTTKKDQLKEDVPLAYLADRKLKGHGHKAPTSTPPSPTKASNVLSRQQSARVTDPVDNVSNSAVKRSVSRAKAKPKPLVDLTPQYREPVHFSSKGKGFVPVTILPGGLVENATTPEDPFSIPSNTLRRNSGKAENRIPQQDMASMTRFGVSIEKYNPFRAGSLLARDMNARKDSKQSQGSGALLDLDLGDNFVQGSLLDRAGRGTK